MNKSKRFELTLLETNGNIENTWEILWTLCGECRTVANRTVQYLWEWKGLSSDYKREYDHYPSKEETTQLLSGKNSIDTYAYSKIIPECQYLSTNSVQAIIRDVKSQYMNALGEILKGSRSITSYKSYPIPINKQRLNVSHIVKYNSDGQPCDEGYFVEVGILSRAGAAHFETDTQLKFKLRVNRDKSLKSFLKQCKGVIELSEIDGKVTKNGCCCEKGGSILPQVPYLLTRRIKMDV